MITVLIGGARSGKSALAVDLAARSGRPVVFVATATRSDDEMAERIDRHRAERPADWRTIEAPVDLVRALDVADDAACVVVDCLSLWTMNVFDDDDATVLARVADQVARARARSGPTIVVGNEVGTGIVPGDPASRRYRDLLGRVNAAWSRVADRAFLVVAGRVLALDDPTDLAP